MSDDVSLPVIDKNHTAKYLVIDGLRHVRKALRALLIDETSGYIPQNAFAHENVDKQEGTIAPRILSWETERSENEKC